MDSINNVESCKAEQLPSENREPETAVHARPTTFLYNGIQSTYFCASAATQIT
jgi:hypothetical protein